MLIPIIKKELLLIFRDIHALAVLFLMPVAFILIMSLALQDTMSEEKQMQPKLGLWIDAPEQQSAGILKTLDRLDGFQVARFETRGQLLDALKQGGITSGIFLPAGFPTALKQAHPAPEDRLELIYAATTPAYLRRLTLASVSRSLAAYQLDRMFGANVIASPDQLAKKRKLLGKSLISTRDLSKFAERKHPSSVQQSVPAWLIFSMFFVVIPISTTLLTERQQGTLQRLKTFPVSSTALLLGKLIPYVAINLIQTLLMFLVGIHLVPMLGGMGLELRGEVWLLLPFALSVSLVAISFALVIATWVNSTEQATTIGGVSNLILAAFGGIMVPTFVMPDLMQAAAAFSPMNWGLEGFLSILLRQGDLQMIAPQIIKLLVLASGLFGLAVLSYRRRIGGSA
jgi:ABC-2 type transport system permease protein